MTEEEAPEAAPPGGGSGLDDSQGVPWLTLFPFPMAPPASHPPLPAASSAAAECPAAKPACNIEEKP